MSNQECCRLDVIYESKESSKLGGGKGPEWGFYMNVYKGVSHIHRLPPPASDPKCMNQGAVVHAIGHHTLAWLHPLENLTGLHPLLPPCALLQQPRENGRGIIGAEANAPQDASNL